MAKYELGSLGPFDGKIGPIVGSRWKGIDYLRSKGRRRRNGNPSPKQQAQLAKFALVGKLVKSMTGLFQVTFRAYANDITEHNYVFAHTITNVLSGVYPNFALDYKKALVSQGSLPNGGNPTASAGGVGEVKFNWVDNSGNGIAKSGDNAILVAYCEALNQCEYKLPAARRDAANDVLTMAAFSGEKVHTWLSFISAEGEVATSIYTGAITVA